MAAKVSVYMAQKKPDEALSFLKRTIAENQDNDRLVAVLHELRGAVLMSQRDFEQSEAAFKKALELYPDLVAPYLSLARLYQATKETNKAIGQYQAILDKQPKFIQAHMALGAIYEAEGKDAEARTMYEKALEINPDFAPAANNLAWMLLQENEDLDRALELAKRAKKQLPDDPNVADTLGLAFLAKGFYPSAISELSDAAEKMPEHPTVLYHLGLAHWKNGDKQEAQAALDKALKVNLDFPEKKKAEKLLEEIRSDRA
jgi:tetratricopeptide (TPR) repeat protein